MRSRGRRAGYPEFAVIGRSNVGKSSLINLLTGRKALAMVSKTPGGRGGAGRRGGRLEGALHSGPEQRGLEGLQGACNLGAGRAGLSLVPGGWRAVSGTEGRPPLPALPSRAVRVRRQDAVHQPLCHQQQLVPGGPARIRVRRQGGAGRGCGPSAVCAALRRRCEAFP